MSHDITLPLEIKMVFVGLLEGPDFNSAVDSDPEVWNFVKNDEVLWKKYRRTVVARKVIEDAIVASFGSTAYLKVDDIVRDGYPKVCAVASRISKEVGKGKWDWQAIYDDYDQEIKKIASMSMPTRSLLKGFKRFLSERDEEEVEAFEELLIDEMDAFLPIKAPKPFLGGKKRSDEANVYEYQCYKTNMILLRAVLNGVF